MMTKLFGRFQKKQTEQQTESQLKKRHPHCFRDDRGYGHFMRSFDGRVIPIRKSRRHCADIH